MIQSHFVHLLVFTILISVFFAFLTKNDWRGRLKIGLILAATLIAASLLISYLLYPFPR
jgi:general stress protein CsbA